MRLDLTEPGGGGGAGVVGGTGEVIPVDTDTDGARLAPAAMLDTEPDAEVVVELPATEPVAAPEPVSEVAASTPAPQAGTTVTMSPPAVTTPVDTDWRRRYYWRVAGKRAVALMLDFAILAGIPIVLAFVYFFFADPASSEAADDAAFTNILWVSLAIFYLGAPLLEASKWRATPGKRLLKLEITTKAGNRISYGRAFVRNVLRTATLYLYMITLGLALIYQYFRFKKSKKFFHDELSSTVIGERLPA